ncbi:MAG: 50S ribosomal protein L25 [Candidatus Cloacimonetes bacterium]|nr:50S ribosomal protein L25 [Candidatus Cloacimonadota bacterium]MBS3767297.1 50S ribosomal protein L25 [Candidatus Cloacimonadota bacterium]
MKLKANIRDTGHKSARKLRKDNQIPAILYGRELDSKPISIDYADFREVYKETLEHTNFIFINIDGEEHRTLIKEIQVEPVSREILHIDFQEIYSGQKIAIEVPLRIIGEAPGLQEGGVLETHLREIEIECMPKDLPDHIEIDISELGLGDSIHIEDILEYYPNINIKQSASSSIVSVQLPMVEEEEEVEEPEELEALEEGEEVAEGEEEAEEDEEEAEEAKETE